MLACAKINYFEVYQTSMNKSVSCQKNIFRCDMMAVINFLLPILLSSLSVNIMFVVDRSILTHYSMNALLVSAIAGSFTYVPLQFLMNLSGISVAFVGQLNGAKNLKKIGNVTWQAIYFSTCISICYLIFGIFYDTYPSVSEIKLIDGVAYQKILMASAGIPGINIALSSFLVGVGNSRTVIYTVIFSNAINIMLDILLVFGYKLIPSLGIIGAAWATIISQLLQTAVLFHIFLNPSNRSKYDTLNFKVNLSLIFKEIKMGLPLAVSNALETLAWYKLLITLSSASKELAVIESFAVSVISFFMFFSNGVARASSAFFANVIGEQDRDKAKKLFILFIKLNFSVCCIFAIPLVFKQSMIFSMIDLINVDMVPLYEDMSFVFICTWIEVLFDGVYSTESGALQAGGDTRFQAYVSIFSVWCCVVFPTMFLYSCNQLSSIRVVYIFIVLYSLMKMLILYVRYKKFSWFNPFLKTREGQAQVPHSRLLSKNNNQMNREE